MSLFEQKSLFRITNISSLEYMYFINQKKYFLFFCSMFTILYLRISLRIMMYAASICVCKTFHEQPINEMFTYTEGDVIIFKHYVGFLII